MCSILTTQRGSTNQFVKIPYAFSALTHEKFQFLQPLTCNFVIKEGKFLWIILLYESSYFRYTLLLYWWKTLTTTICSWKKWTRIYVRYEPVGCCNMEYPPETYIKLKSREILFGHNSLLICRIVLKFCTQHGSITAVLCANFQNDLTDEMHILILNSRYVSDGYSMLQQFHMGAVSHMTLFSAVVRFPYPPIWPGSNVCIHCSQSQTPIGLPNNAKAGTDHYCDGFGYQTLCLLWNAKEDFNADFLISEVRFSDIRKYFLI